jgi:C4-dicarboxylate-specific signal transduction histidine kinase
VERLFDPFFSTKEPGRGTGLGLAVSARLVSGMGGAIHLVDPSEAGAAFEILLPIVSVKEPE